MVLATFRLIAEKGVEGLRIRDVATSLGMNIGTLYYYFPTKEGLIQGVVDYIVQQIVTIQAPAALIPIQTPVDELRQHFTNLTYQIRETPDIFRVMCELLLRAKRDSAIYPILRKTDENWQQYLVAILSKGIEQGFFRTDLDTHVTARVIMAFFKGMPVQLGMSPEELEEAVNHLERWLLKGTDV